jgi:hypothetical protein
MIAGTSAARPAPGNSEITTVTEGGVTTETRRFLDPNRRIEKVVVTTRDGKRTARVYYRDNTQKDLPDNAVEGALVETADKLEDVASKTVDVSKDVGSEAADKLEDVGGKTKDVAGEIGDKAEDVGDKTVSGAKKVGEATASGAKKAGSATAKGVKKAGSAVKDVIP